MQQLDPRLLEIVVTVGAKSYSFSGTLYIRAQGMLFANLLLDTCEVTIQNLARDTQDFLLNVTSPYTANRDDKSITVLAGRESYGTTLIYKGSILVANASQPPDIGITFTCLSGASFQNTVYSVNSPGISTYLENLQRLANRFKATLRSEFPNLPNVNNYHFNGTAIQELAHINSFGKGSSQNAFGNVTSFLTVKDTNVLVIKGNFVPLNGTLRVLSESTGMIGVPEWTELGVKVTFLIDNKTQIGGGLQIISKRYPAFNGLYAIYKLGFNLANWETPFYYIAEAARAITPGVGIPPFTSGDIS